MELYGTEGTLIIPDPNFFGGQLELAGHDGELAEVPLIDHAFGRPNEIHGKLGWVANYRCAGLADMVSAIRNNTEHRCAIDLCVHVVEAMTAILEAGEIGQFITLKTTCQRPAALDADAASQLLARS